MMIASVLHTFNILPDGEQRFDPETDTLSGLIWYVFSLYHQVDVYIPVLLIVRRVDSLVESFPAQWKRKL